VLIHLLSWYARYVVAVLGLGAVLIALTWGANIALDQVRRRRRG
jgi:hypothetical protein